MDVIGKSEKKRLVREVEMMHEKCSTDAKTLCGEMLAEVEKNHSIWEAQVETKGFLETSSSLPCAVHGTFYFSPAPSLLVHPNASERSTLGSFSSDPRHLACLSSLSDSGHAKASPLLPPILSDDQEFSALGNLGLLRVKKPYFKNVSQENGKGENGNKPSSVSCKECKVQPPCSDANIEYLKALMDKQLSLAVEKPLNSHAAVFGENGGTQKMVVEYELLRRLEKLKDEGEMVVNKRVNKFDGNNQEQTDVNCRAEPTEVKKEQPVDVQSGVAQHLPLGGQVVVKKVTAMKRPDQVLYLPPFSRQTINNNGVGRGRGASLHQRLPKGRVLEDADIVGCKNVSKPAGRGKPVERVKKRRPEGEGSKEEQGPRVESIKYQDVQQGVKREKMMKKSPVKEDVEYQQRDASNQRQLVLHKNSGGDRKHEVNEEKKWKKAQSENDEREEYWRRLEQQIGAANSWGKRVQRGSAEEARQAGARTQGKAFNSPHHLNQQNYQRRARRIEDLKVHLAVVADLERNLEANGSIDAKSLEDIGRKEEYEMELRSLEDMKL